MGAATALSLFYNSRGGWEKPPPSERAADYTR